MTKMWCDMCVTFVKSIQRTVAENFLFFKEKAYKLSEKSYNGYNETI